MDVKGAQQVIREAVNWLPKDSAGRIILESFELDVYNDEAFAIPIPFNRFTELKEWGLAKDNAAVTARIRYIQESMDTREFPLRTSLYLTHDKGFCILALGNEQVEIIRRKKEDGGLQNVTLSFSEKRDSDKVARLNKGELFSVKASSPIDGWLYLFVVDANRIISSVYSGEGRVSEVHLPQNTPVEISTRVDEVRKLEAIRQDKPHIPLRYTGDKEGIERIVAMVIKNETPVPVSLAHMRSRFPLPVLFAHEQRYKGMGDGAINSTNDFSSLSLDQIAIGTVDYYYDA